MPRRFVTGGSGHPSYMGVQYRKLVDQVRFEDLPHRPRRTGQPAILGPDEVRRKLAYLTDWCGDEHALHRTITRPDGSVHAWRQHLERVLEVSGHGGRIVHEDGCITVELRTESVHGVTAYDIALAQRIDDVLLDGEHAVEELQHHDGDYRARSCA